MAPLAGVGLSAAPARTTTAHQGSGRSTRRHPDNLLVDGMSEAREARYYGSRGRGRPARLVAITDPGRSAFEHAYDDLATSALSFLAETAGPGVWPNLPAGRSPTWRTGTARQCRPRLLRSRSRY